MSRPVLGERIRVSDSVIVSPRGVWPLCLRGIGPLPWLLVVSRLLGLQPLIERV